MKDWKNDDYIHYFYKITNLTNGRYYYGIHSLSKSDKKEPLTDGYFGSGVEISEDIKKLGKDKFKKEIIKVFSTRQEVSDMEKSIVTLDEVNKPECYNKIPGGDTYGESMLGKVACRPKDNLNKVIILPKELYHNNKDKYIVVTHSLKKKKGDYYRSNVDETERHKRIRTDYLKTQKKDKDDTKFSRIRWFVNKDSLELRKFIGHSEPEDLYIIWFPQYFLDKVNSRFITKDYFESLFKSIHNLEKISKLIGVGRRYLKLVRDFYKLDLGKYKSHPASKAFSGKKYVNNGTEELIIESSELERYIKNGYAPGKLTILPKQDIMNYYTSGNGIKDCAKKFSTIPNKIKEVLGIDSTFEIRIYCKSGRVTRLLVNKNIHEKLIENGWKLGRK